MNLRIKYEFIQNNNNNNLTLMLCSGHFGLERVLFSPKRLVDVLTLH